MAKKSALGRGLGALITDSQYDGREGEKSVTIESFGEIAPDKIELNPFQPRKEFNEELLNELATSIKEVGVIQPITVKRLEEDKFQLISGERRLRASKIAGLSEIPAYIKEVSDNEVFEMALVENIHRKDLNPIEIAISYQRLIEECKLTQDALSTRLSQRRSTITNHLRLLSLPAEVQIGLRDEKISMGHAKAITSVEKPDNQIKLFFKIINEGLSVRKSEELAKDINTPRAKRRTTDEKVQLQERYVDFTKNLKQQLSTNVELKMTKRGNGRIVIPFKTNDDLERIMNYLESSKAEEISNNQEQNETSNE